MNKVVFWHPFCFIRDRFKQINPPKKDKAMKMTQNMKKIVGFLLGFMFLMTSNAFSGPSFEQKEINEVGWELTFVSRVYDPVADATTFTYSMYVQGWEKDLSHWVLAIDSNTVPSGSGTDTSYGLDPTTGVYGFKWDDGQAKGSTMIYTVTLSGNIGEAIVEYSVKGGTYFAIDEIAGPGAPVPPPSYKYSIAGIAFVDVNGNGIIDPDEPRLSNVSVELFNGNGELVAVLLSDSLGRYQFDGLNGGNYVVKILGETIAQDMNEVIFGYMIPVNGPISLNLNADVTGKNFGFRMNTAAIIADLNPADPDGDGFTFVGTGKTIGFWKHQNTVALKGKGRAQVDAATLRIYFNAIRALHLAVPFQFPFGGEFATALDIMGSTSSDEVDLLTKQLLATEFNHVAGQGLPGEFRDLQSMIIAWAEFMVKNNSLFTREELLKAKDICDMINNTGEAL